MEVSFAVWGAWEQKIGECNFRGGRKMHLFGGQGKGEWGLKKRPRGDGEILFSGEPPFYIHPLSMAWKYMGLRKCFLRSQAECCSLLMSCRENGKVMSAFFS